MKIVELNKDTALDLLAEVINDINETGVVPDKMIIFSGDMRYQVGYSTDAEIAQDLFKECIAINASDLIQEYFGE